MWYRLAVILTFLMRPLPEPITYRLDKVIDWIHHRDDIARAKKTFPILDYSQPITITEMSYEDYVRSRDW